MTMISERGLEIAAHTPGPWKWQWAVDVNGYADGRIFTGWNTVVGISAPLCVAVSPRFQTEAQWSADACLIAAAPDVSDVLRTILLELSAGPRVGAHTIARAYAAIAKAESRRQ